MASPAPVARSGAASQAEAVSATIGRYRVLGEVARGGMGAVYRAEAPDGQTVALKLLLAGRQATPRQRRRFEGEARALLALRHPQVVPLLDAGAHQGVPFLVLQWVEGESLEERLLRQGPLAPAEAARVLHGVAGALAHCHAQGVLHRDLKPGNVLLRRSDGAGLLTDFGLARGLVDAATLAGTDARTLSGAGLGTPGFWAPEQARGEHERVGPRADVYGLGATLYAALTGVAPHEGPDLVSLLQAHERPPLPPSARAPGVPPALDAVCLRCLAPDPAGRYPDVTALEADLQAVIEGRPPAALSGSSRAVRRATAGLVVLGLAALSLGAALRWSAAAEPATPTLADERPAPGGPHPQDLPSSPGEPPEDPAEAPEDPAARVARAIAAAERPLPEAKDTAAQEAARAAAERALQLIRSGRSREALEELDLAVRLDPRLGSAWYNRGLVRLELGDPDGALEDFTRSVVLGPQQPRGWQNRAAARGLLGDLAGAEADLTRVLELAPGWPDARRDRGILRARRGDLPGAREDLDQALEERPEDPEAWFNRGLVRGAARDHRGAIEDSARALELGCARPAFAWLCRGNAQAELGEWSAALDDLRRARELLPEDPDIAFNLALILVRHGEHADARALTNELLDREPRSARTLALRARAHLGLSDPTRALADAEAALALAPRLDVAHLRLGLAREALGLPGARQAIERYLELARADEECRPEAEAALARLR